MPKKKIGALWIRSGSKGEFLSGKLEDGTKIVGWRNASATAENKRPDWELFEDDWKPTPRSGQTADVRGDVHEPDTDVDY